MEAQEITSPVPPPAEALNTREALAQFDAAPLDVPPPSEPSPAGAAQPVIPTPTDLSALLPGDALTNPNLAGNPSLTPDLPGTPAGGEGRILHLSTFDVDLDKVKAGDPLEIAKFVRHDEVTRQQQSELDRLRSQVKNPEARTAPPAPPPPPPAAPVAAITQENLTEAWNRYADSGTKSDMDAYLALSYRQQEQQRAAETESLVKGSLSAYHRLMQEKGYFVNEDLRSIAQARAAEARVDARAQEMQAEIGYLASFGLESVKSVDPIEAGRVYDHMIEKEIPAYNAAHPSAPINMADPVTARNARKMALDYVLEQKKVSPGQPPAVAAGGVLPPGSVSPQTRLPANAPPLPRSAPAGGGVPGAVSGIPGVSQSVPGQISREHAEQMGLTMNQIMNGGFAY